MEGIERAETERVGQESPALSISITDCGVVSSDPSLLRLYLDLPVTTTSEAVAPSRLFLRLRNLPGTRICLALSDGVEPLVTSSKTTSSLCFSRSISFRHDGLICKTLGLTFISEPAGTNFVLAALRLQVMEIPVSGSSGKHIHVCSWGGAFHALCFRREARCNVFRRLFSIVCLLRLRQVSFVLFS